MSKLLIIDTFNFLHRAYHAVYGVTSMLITVLTTHKPDYLVAALDSKEPTFRIEDFTGYKAHRKPMEDDLSVQIPKVFEILDAFDIKQIVVNGYEADDVIGTIVEKFKNKDLEIVVISNDRDLWQLISDKVTVMIPKGPGQDEFIGPEEVVTRMELVPSQIPDYKGLRGDPSDNIPGVYGVGEVMAKKLIKEYQPTLVAIEKLFEVTPESLQKKLAANAEEAVMSKKLATIISDVPFDVDLKDCMYRDFVASQVREVLTKYNFKSLLKRLGLTEQKELSKNQLGLF